MTATHDRSYGRRLRRGRRAWDLLSRAPAERGERPMEPVRAIGIEQLGLQPGEAVLDAGCGVGSFFPQMREAVGDQGRVVGVDYSPKMVDRAQQRVRAEGWRNVEVRRADLSDDGLEPETFTAAVALASLSATPDPLAAIRNIHHALRPGGRLFVFDFRLVGRRRRLVPGALRFAYNLLAGGGSSDVRSGLAEVFPSVEDLPGSSDGIVIAIARKSD